MKIIVTSVMVDDQQKAKEYYTEKLGFVIKHDIPMGEYSWLTVVPPGEGDGVELLLEPTAFPPSKIYQKQLFDANIPATMFGVYSVDNTYQTLKEKGVTFKTEPTTMGDVRIAVFDDTCGNLIQIVERL
jgi:catechol 2,3-dioxygenase-like lactoylglutathione lyase family enzyme